MSSDRLNLLDLVKALDPKGRPAMVAEVLHQTNAIVQDAPTYPSNGLMSNRVTLRSSLPTVSYSRLDQGIVKSKGSVRQQVDTIGYLAGRSEVDKRHKKYMGEAAFNRHRWLEDKAFIESMNQTVAESLLYGDEASNPLEFTGLAPRLDTLASAITGSQVVSMGSVTGSDGTSIYIVDWGEDTCHLIHPENHPAGGLEVDNRGEMDVDDADGNPFCAYVTEYHWMVGLVVKDPRHIARLANIDLSDASAPTPAQGNLVDAIMDIMVSMPSPKGPRVAYADRRIVSALAKQARNNASHVTIQEWQSMPTVHVMGYPIRRVDQISVAESAVS